MQSSLFTFPRRPHHMEVTEGRPWLCVGSRHTPAPSAGAVALRPLGPAPSLDQACTDALSTEAACWTVGRSSGLKLMHACAHDKEYVSWIALHSRLALIRLYCFELGGALGAAARLQGLQGLRAGRELGSGRASASSK